MQHWTVRALLLALAAVLLLSSCSFFKGDSVEEQLGKTLALYAERNQNTLTDEEVLAILSAGGELEQAVVEEHIALGDQAVPIARLCRIIYLAEGSGLDSRSLRGQNLVQLLSSRQREDATFGFLEETMLAALTLENVGGSYDRDGVLRLLITAQRPDGSFVQDGETVGSPALTGQILLLLSCFDDDSRADTMAQRAITYLETLVAAELDCATVTSLLLGLLDIGQGGDSATLQALRDQLLACQNEDGSFSPTPGAAADTAATWRGLTALDALQRGGSLWNTLVLRDSAVSIEIRMPDGNLHYGSRLRLQEGDTALAATVRFCATNGISLEYRLSEVLAFDDVRNNIGQQWQLTVNGEAASSSHELQPGDAMVWQWK